MSDRHALIAFCATLITIFGLAICAAVAANHGKDTSAYLGAITGLIGVIGTFRPKGNPVAATENGDVNVTPDKPIDAARTAQDAKERAGLA